MVQLKSNARPYCILTLWLLINFTLISAKDKRSEVSDFAIQNRGAFFGIVKNTINHYYSYTSAPLVTNDSLSKIRNDSLSNALSDSLLRFLRRIDSNIDLKYNKIESELRKIQDGVTNLPTTTDFNKMKVQDSVNLENKMCECSKSFTDTGNAEGEISYIFRNCKNDSVAVRNILNSFCSPAAPLVKEKVLRILCRNRAINPKNLSWFLKDLKCDSNVLVGLDLSNCSFEGTNLDGLDFSRCKFNKARFNRYTSVKNTNFNAADLRNAIGFDSISNLYTCIFNYETKVDSLTALSDSIWKKGVIHGLDLAASIKKSNFQKAQDTILKYLGKNMDRKDLRFIAAYGTGDALTGLNFSGCSFKGTKLDNLNFSRCIFTTAVFNKFTSVQNMNIDGADMREALGFDSISNIKDANYSCRTKVDNFSILDGKIRTERYWYTYQNDITNGVQEQLKGLIFGLNYFEDRWFLKSRFISFGMGLDMHKWLVYTSFGFSNVITHDKEWVGDGLIFYKDGNGFWQSEHDTLTYLVTGDENFFSRINTANWWFTIDVTRKWKRHLETEIEIGMQRKDTSKITEEIAVRSLPGHHFYADTVIRETPGGKSMNYVSAAGVLLYSNTLGTNFFFGVGPGLFLFNTKSALTLNGYLFIPGLKLRSELVVRYNPKNGFAGIGGSIMYIASSK